MQIINTDHSYLVIKVTRTSQVALAVRSHLPMQET